MILGLPPDFELEIDQPSLDNVIDIPSPTTIRIDSNDFELLNKTIDTDVSYLSNKFQSIISLQNEQVEALIHEENERIRRIQEEEQRKQKEEELRKQKQQEELEKKKREAEHKRLEEEKLQKERLQKQEEEKRAKEKLKEIEDKKKQEQKKLEEEERLKKLKQAEAEKSESADAKFLLYQEKIKHFKTDIKDAVNNNKELKKAVGPVRRALNPKFGQLSDSRSQLNDITRFIIDQVNVVKGHEPAFSFILNFIAKAIVSQAEAEIVVQPNAALPLATLASNILNAFPELHEYLMARLVKKCPLIIGYTCGIDTEEGRYRMGWRRKESKWEEIDKYDERLAGICSLFAVLTRVNQKFFPISMSWTFLARMGNLDRKLILNVHFFCIANWWESCAKHFIQAYGIQACKLLQVLAFNLTEGFNFPAATRVRLLGEEGIHPNIKTIKEMVP